MANNSNLDVESSAVQKHLSPDMPERRRRSIRLRGYDYTRHGAYFVTICTRNWACLLGDVIEGTTHLSEAGQLAQAVWEDLPRHYPHVQARRLDNHAQSRTRHHRVDRCGHRIRRCTLRRGRFQTCPYHQCRCASSPSARSQCRRIPSPAARSRCRCIPSPSARSRRRRGGFETRPYHQRWCAPSWTARGRQGIQNILVQTHQHHSGNHWHAVLAAQLLRTHNPR